MNQVIFYLTANTDSLLWTLKEKNDKTVSTQTVLSFVDQIWIDSLDLRQAYFNDVNNRGICIEKKITILMIVT